MGTRIERSRRNAMIAAYRAKARRWTMEVMPTMSEAQWDLYTQWITSWGRKGPVVRMKARHRLAAARKVGHISYEQYKYKAPTRRV